MHRIYATVVMLALVGCDQLSAYGNRYEISRDQAGRTLRIDKRTGEVALIEGDKIYPLRDGKSVADESAAEERKLAGARSFPVITVNHMALEASLQTSWQDGKLYYSVDFRPMSSPEADDSKASKSIREKLDEARREANLPQFKQYVQGHTFTMLLEDVPFQLVQQALQLTYIADDKGNTVGYNSKGSVAMSREMYKKIDTWNVNWRARL